MVQEGRHPSLDLGLQAAAAALYFRSQLLHLLMQAKLGGMAQLMLNALPLMEVSRGSVVGFSL
jgi:hypothetical protein